MPRLATALRRGIATLVAVSTFAAASACGGPESSAAAEEITLGYQPGLGYATLLIIKEQGTLEKQFPDTKINWKRLDSGAALRDGVISGDIQVASMGAGPFLVGVDAGVGWKTIASMNEMNLKLMVTDPKISSLKDFAGDDKIAMPAPDSIQSVVLRKGVKEQLGDARALDTNIAALGHPDGLKALIAGQIAGHLTAPPFIAQEQEQGAREILASYDLFGRHAFNSVYATQDFVDANEEFVEGLSDALVEATALLNDDPAAASKIIAAESDGELAEAEVNTQITDPDVTWTTTPTGFATFAEFMAEIEMIKKVPSRAELFFDNDLTADGN